MRDWRHSVYGVVLRPSPPPLFLFFLAATAAGDRTAETFALTSYILVLPRCYCSWGSNGRDFRIDFKREMFVLNTPHGTKITRSPKIARDPTHRARDLTHRAQDPTHRARDPIHWARGRPRSPRSPEHQKLPEIRLIGPVIRLISGPRSDCRLIGPEIRLIGPEIRFIGPRDRPRSPRSPDHRKLPEIRLIGSEIQLIGPEIRFIRARDRPRSPRSPDYQKKGHSIKNPCPMRAVPLVLMHPATRSLAGKRAVAVWAERRVPACTTRCCAFASFPQD